MSEKKNEITTYQKLKLGREHKSTRKRNKVNEERLYRYVGENTPERPYIKVSRAEYMRLWDEINQKIAMKENVSGFSVQKLADVRSKQVERAVYDEFARRQQSMSDLEDSFQSKQGRKMTPHERDLYGRMLTENDCFTSNARAVRKAALQGVLKKIEDRNRNQPAKLQQAWAMVVGEMNAQETFLEKIESNLAIVRCLSSTLSFQLRRKKDLAPQLSKILGTKIQRIVFR